MSLHLYCGTKDRDIFIVTDDAYMDQMANRFCPNPGDELEKGECVFGNEQGERAAFDETIAMISIDS
jgi:hypothetical protein